MSMFCFLKAILFMQEKLKILSSTQPKPLALPKYLLSVTNMTTKTIPIWNNLVLHYGCIKRRISLQKGFHLIFVYESTCDACVQACLADRSIASSLSLSTKIEHIFLSDSQVASFFLQPPRAELWKITRRENNPLFTTKR